MAGGLIKEEEEEEFYHRLHAAAAAESSNKMLRVLGFHALMFGEASAQHSSPAKNKDSALGGGSAMQNGI